MDAGDVKAKLRSYIIDQFKIPENDPDFTDEVHLFDFGYIDSFGAVNLISFIEAEYSIQISKRDLVVYPLNTICEIMDFIIRRKKGEL